MYGKAEEYLVAHRKEAEKEKKRLEMEKIIQEKNTRRTGNNPYI